MSTMKVRNAIHLYSLINDRSVKGCANCGAEFEDDDFAFALETGICQHCHKLLDKVITKQSSSKTKVYGIYNTRAKEFQFGIRETSKRKAMQKLFDKIGNDARKWRFEVREIKGDRK